MFDSTTPDQDSGLEDAVFAVKGKKLLCRDCRHVITYDNQETTRQGQFIHYRTNPAGYTYEFCCYATAPGCSTLGVATSMHTWFPGYSWKLAACQACAAHLGWLFEGDASFYGLIRNRLVSEE